MIRLYDFEFNLLHIEPRCISTRWTLYFNDVGTLEAHFLPDEEIVRLILEKKYLVIEEKGKFAIITGYVMQENFTVYGRTCNWLLSKRAVNKFDKITGTADSITRGIVNTAFADVDNFALGNPLEITETIEFSKDSSALASDVVTECLKLQNCGHRLEFDVENKRWLYCNIQSRQNNLILSAANKNAYGIEFSYDLLDLADCGYYEKKVKNTDSDSETAVTTYLSDENTKTGIYRWEAILTGSEESEAENNLKSKAAKDEVTLSTRNVKYGDDYALGDILRVQIIKNGLRSNVKKRVSGVEIVHRSGSCSEQPIFEEV